MSLRISELDFDQIKTNLKDFLRSQDEFNSYDFEASGLSVLLDILAYNTHYDAYMANQIHNEAFLDSAIKRSSVVSRAKELDYLPKSAKAATAIVDIVMNDSENVSNFLTLNKYTTFNSSINGTTYTFVNTKTYTIGQVDGQYKFSSVELKEGRPYSYNFSVVTPGPAEKYTIPNDNVDIDSITVTVQTSSTDSTIQVFSRVDTITDLNSESNVYYIEENMSGKYDVFFGDGILGKKLTAGNIVKVEYIITNADAANVSANFNQSFTLSGSIGNGLSISINVIQNSMGGAQRESLDSIKFNAPRAFATQDRAVISDDYLSLITNNISNIESVFVWGGEDNDPPVYGKVFISLKPYSGYTVSATQKEQIKNDILKKKNMLTVIPEFVDPEYVWLHLDVQASYKKDTTTKTEGQLNQIITSAVYNYFANELQKFDRNFVLSRLVKQVVESDAAIYSAQVIIRVQKRIYPTLNIAQSHTLNFLAKLHPTDMESTKFYINLNGTLTPVTIKDVPTSMPPDYNGSGVLNLYNADTGILVVSNIGTIDYATGKVTITDLNVAGFLNDQYDIRLTCNVQEFSNDISSVRNNIFVLDDSTKNTLVNRNVGLDIQMVAV